MKKSHAGILLLTAAVILTAVTILFGSEPSVHGLSARRSAVALIYVEGMIEGGRGSSAFTDTTVGADVICGLLDEVALNPRFAAVVLRLNSPGGTAAGSQDIAAAVSRLRDRGIVVVASMADVAASGAYWIASAADEIIASPATMTGSIGAIMQVHNLEQLFDRLGISVETFKSGDHKDMGSPVREMSDAERAVFQSLIDDIHDQFIDAVATGRGLPPTDVRGLADGRVFTGRQALEAGLVDRLGDLTVALDRAAELAGIAEYEVEEMGRTTLFGRLLRSVRRQEIPAAWRSLREILLFPWPTQGS